MRRAAAHLAVLVLAVLAVWNARCLTSCVSDSLVPPCHKQKTKHGPQVSNCTLQMVVERTAVSADATPVTMRYSAAIWSSRGMAPGVEGKTSGQAVDTPPLI